MAGFYLDHNIALGVADLLRADGYDVVTARDLGLERATDDEHLLIAAQRGWTLVTNNRKDFILLHAAWRRWSQAWQVAQEHAGILILHQDLLAPQAAQELQNFLQAGLPLVNALYLWRRGSGWVHRP